MPVDRSPEKSGSKRTTATAAAAVSAAAEVAEMEAAHRREAEENRRADEIGRRELAEVEARRHASTSSRPATPVEGDLSAALVLAMLRQSEARLAERQAAAMEHQAAAEARAEERQAARLEAAEECQRAQQEAAEERQAALMQQLVAALQGVRAPVVNPMVVAPPVAAVHSTLCILHS